VENLMQMVTELEQKQAAHSIVSAIESYKIRLQASIGRTQRRLTEFEQRYNVATDYFLETMTAEDLQGGDIEYVTWAGEAKLLAGLQNELAELPEAKQ
jgi:hypothetical protein